MVKYYFIDLFCGAGGVTTGIRQANAEVLACVNHDTKAIESHEANHPDVLHFIEDIRTLDLTAIIQIVAQKRRNEPNAVICLWASLECTNFSKAKGGKPRDADSRTLAEHLFRYYDAFNPDMVWIENVEEFMSWGPLDDNGKPVSKDKGKDYVKWVNSVKRYGYNFDHRILNCADYGANTSRKRYFAQFAKPQIMIVWPKPTHSKNAGLDLFSNLKPWKAVKHVLNLEIEGTSIITRKKALSENTEKRVYEGLIKYVAGGKNAFLMKYNSTNKNGKHVPPSIDEPCPVVSCQNRLGIMQIQRQFLVHFRGNSNVHSIESSHPTLATRDKHGLFSTHFLGHYYTGGGQLSSIGQPHPAVRTRAGALLTVPKMNPVSVFLMNPQYSNKGGDLNKPCFTLIARMDKAPPHLIQLETGEVYIQVFDTDSPTMIKIKEFMALYGISDILMRMLLVPELLRIQGFSDDYYLSGTQADKKKFIGNAVPPPMVKSLVEASMAQFKEEKILQAV